MPFSHHSHSGQFCPGHAQNSLEEIIQTAISKRMQVLALTEHMPRHDVDSYPEELEAGLDIEGHYINEGKYFQEALRLREKYSSQIELLIGFEADWIRKESVDLIQESLRKYRFDYFIGSVHHVHTIPIDFSKEMYLQAREVAGSTDEKLFEDYFDSQLAMLQTLKPPVVGHFDLIRLMSDDPDQNFQSMSGVWQRVLRNLDFIASYDGILELNFASLRKGMTEPYPQANICKAFIERQGRFCLSDDSHGVDQVALNYHQVLPFLQKASIKTLHFLTHTVVKEPKPTFADFPHLRIGSLEVDRLKENPFWAASC